MKIHYTDHFELPLPPGHRFPMDKYRRLRRRIVEDPDLADDVLLVPPAATDEQLLLAHSTRYLSAVCEGKLSDAEIRRIGFPWSPKMVERSRRSTGATMAAARSVLSSSSEGLRASVNLAGGTHHAMRDAGEGYCVFNDAAVTLLTLKQEGLIERALVIDLDVHQGNGTAEILEKSEWALTLSMHGRKNFPARKHPSDIDIDLEDGTDDETYLGLLGGALEDLTSREAPDLVIYLAGADPFRDDRLGRMNLTMNGLARRDQLVLQYCSQQSLPVAIAMAGGYCEDIDRIVDIHHQTVSIASSLSKISNAETIS
ncbi:MAG: histone deacetylase [Planctomycetota bacterium]